jgi:multidrug efflux pump subunit AcrA (membrane-fusion protein)
MKRYKGHCRLIKIGKILIASITIMLIVTGCNGDKAVSSNQDNDEVIGDVIPSTNPCSILTVTNQNVATEYSYTGELRPVQEYDVSLEIAGLIKDVGNYQVGDLVKKGSLLASNDTQQLHINYDRAVLAVEDALIKKQQLEKGTKNDQITSAEATLTRNNLRYQQIEIEYERTQKLYEQGAIPYTQVENLLNQLELTKQDIKQAQSQLNLLINSVEEEDVRKAEIAYQQALLNQREAELKLENTKLYAPTTSVVITKYVENGQNIAAGQPIFRLAEDDLLKVIIDIPLAELQTLEQAAEVQVIKNDSIRKGTINKISNIVTSGLASIEVEIHIDNKDGAFRIGDAVDVKYGIEQSSVMLPIEAVMNVDRSFVFVIVDDKAIRRDITLGIPVNNKIQVFGIDEGERVVVAGMERLRDGDNITIIEEYAE